VDEPRRPAHDRHDLELVARLAAGDLGPGEAVAARDLLATCDACAALATDLRAIATATRDLGSAAVRAASAASAASAVAPRDFRITAADAERLRRRGFPGLARAIARDPGLARGVGGALATLGLVGLLVSAGLPGLSGSAASAPTREELGSGGAVDGASPVPAMWPPATDFHALTTSGEPPGTNYAPGDGTSPVPTPWRVATIVSSGALVAGLALLLIGRTRHRIGP
jgi:anti-sigma factor RsiW